jgi:hypothetical protein
MAPDHFRDCAVRHICPDSNRAADRSLIGSLNALANGTGDAGRRRGTAGEGLRCEAADEAQDSKRGQA